MKKDAYIIRARRLDGRFAYWIMFAADGTKLVGKFRETKINIVRRWFETFGGEWKLTRFTGVSSPAEAAATIASIQHPISKPENKNGASTDSTSAG